MPQIGSIQIYDLPYVTSPLMAFHGQFTQIWTTSLVTEGYSLTTEIFLKSFQVAVRIALLIPAVFAYAGIAILAVLRTMLAPTAEETEAAAQATARLALTRLAVLKQRITNCIQDIAPMRLQYWEIADAPPKPLGIICALSREGRRFQKHAIISNTAQYQAFTDEVSRASVELDTQATRTESEGTEIVACTAHDNLLNCRHMHNSRDNSSRASHDATYSGFRTIRDLADILELINLNELPTNFEANVLAVAHA